uniref:Uncharacterized protein n=1 Tax=Anopheles christyi TaxID=43041 RepID=A0A182KHS0_9DIPT
MLSDRIKLDVIMHSFSLSLSFSRIWCSVSSYVPDCLALLRSRKFVQKCLPKWVARMDSVQIRLSKGVFCAAALNGMVLPPSIWNPLPYRTSNAPTHPLN